MAQTDFTFSEYSTQRTAIEKSAEYQRLRDRQTAKALKAQGYTLEHIATEMKLPLATIRRYTK